MIQHLCSFDEIILSRSWVVTNPRRREFRHTVGSWGPNLWILIRGDHHMVETRQTVIQLLLSCCGSRSAKMSLQIYGKRVEVWRSAHDRPINLGMYHFLTIDVSVGWAPSRGRNKGKICKEWGCRGLSQAVSLYYHRACFAKSLPLDFLTGTYLLFFNIWVIWSV